MGNEEEVLLLEEQLAAANADVERLQERLADAEARLATQTTAAADVARRLGALESAAAEETAALLARAEEAERRSVEAAGRYRALLLRSEPELADLVAGDSVDEIDAAADKARQTVAQVRQRLEEQAQALRVSPGAPVRAGPEVASLSPAEKIRLGLQDR